MRSKRSVSARRSVSATASGWSAKRAAIASGVVSTCAWLPRRSGSEASSVVCSRMATKASCRRARAQACARGRRRSRRTARRGAAPALEAAVERPVVAMERALELDPERVGAEDPQQPAHRRFVVHAVTGAAAEADETLGVRLEVVEGDRRGAEDPARRVVTGVRVGAREEPGEVAPAGRVADEQVTWRPSAYERRPRPHGSPAGPAPARPARTPSIPRPCHGR